MYLELENFYLKLFSYLDTLLNVFLAIACDNLTKAKEMTEAQEEEERIQQELKEKCLQNEIKIDSDEPVLNAEDLEKAPPKKSW